MNDMEFLFHRIKCSIRLFRLRNPIVHRLDFYRIQFIGKFLVASEWRNVQQRISDLHGKEMFCPLTENEEMELNELTLTPKYKWRHIRGKSSKR